MFAAIVALLLPAPARAQNVTSWVASGGNNSNPCTRSQPCLTFETAIVKTNAGGQVSCIDAGEFGGGQLIDIVRTITIDCEGVGGGMLGPAVNVPTIQIEAGPNDVVIIRGLFIGNIQNSTAGIGFLSGGELRVEKCIIYGFSDGSGIAFQNGQSSPSPMVLMVSDTALVNNGIASSGAGILVQPTMTNSISKVVLDHVVAQGNFFGIKADGTMTAGGVINMTVRESVAAGNTSNGIVATGNSAGPAIIMKVDRSTSSHNAAGFGVIADGPKTTIRLNNSTVSGNIKGIGASNGGVLASYMNNDVDGNSTDGSPTTIIGFK